MMPTKRELDFGMRCIKYMLCTANLMFVIVGLLLISIGYTIKAIYSNFDQFMESHYYNPSTLAIVIGFFIFALAMFGCVGAIKESTCLVNTYAFFLTIILVLEIAVSIAAYAMRSNIEVYISTNMHRAMENYDRTYNAYTWNSTQYNLGCCGIHNYTDWQQYKGREGFALTNTTSPISNETLFVPSSCCENENCSLRLYSHGCLQRLSYIVSQCALLLAVGALCVSFIQVLGIIFSSMLARSIRKVKSQMLVEREERRRHFYDEMVKSQERAAKRQPVTLIDYTPKDSDA